MALEEGRKPEIDVLSEERTTPKQPNFSKDYIWTVTLINRLLYDKKPCQKTIDNFFTGAFAQVSFPKNSENSYWENLFAYAWVHSQRKNFG